MKQNTINKIMWADDDSDLEDLKFKEILEKTSKKRARGEEGNEPKSKKQKTSLQPTIRVVKVTKLAVKREGAGPPAVKAPKKEVKKVTTHKVTKTMTVKREGAKTRTLPQPPKENKSVAPKALRKPAGPARVPDAQPSWNFFDTIQPRDCKPIQPKKRKAEDNIATPPKKAKVDSSAPAGLANFKNSCFANAALQLLDSIPEIVDHLKGHEKLCNKQILNHFSGLEGQGKIATREAKKEHERVRKAFRELPIPPVQSAYLGRVLVDMEKAKKAGKSTSTYLSLQALHGQLHQFGGLQQEDADEFLTKLIPILQSEEMTLASRTEEESIIKNTMMVKERSKMHCCECNSDHSGAESEAYKLVLNVEDQKAPLEFQELLKRRLQPSICDDYICESCGKKDSTQRTEHVSRLGEYLLIALDRGIWSVDGEAKAQTKVCGLTKTFSLHTHRTEYNQLSKQERADDDLFSKDDYEAVAIVEHFGDRPQQGHYIATRKVGDRWYRCDDEKVTTTTKAEMEEGMKATLILLKRV